MLGPFHRRFPAVQIEFTVDNTDVIERKLLANELDLGFIGAEPASSTVLVTHLIDDEIVCFCSPTHDLASRKRIAPSTLSSELWIVRERGSATRRFFESSFLKAGGHLRQTIELGEPEAIKSIVASGLGISFMSSLGLAEAFHLRKLVRLPVTGMSLHRPIYYAFHANKHVTPTQRAFIDEVKAACSA